MVDDSLNRTGASLLIDALQKNGINNLYGVVGIMAFVVKTQP